MRRGLRVGLGGAVTVEILRLPQDDNFERGRERPSGYANDNVDRTTTASGSGGTSVTGGWRIRIWLVGGRGGRRRRLSRWTGNPGRRCELWPCCRRVRRSGRGRVAPRREGLRLE